MILWTKTNKGINNKRCTLTSPESETTLAFGIIDFEGWGTQRGAKQTAEEEPRPKGHAGNQ